jgi:hypothetical protein
VITTKFYVAKGSQIATCHAHGDGTWNLLFSPAGKAELSKMKTSPATEAALEVAVFQRIDEGGRVFNYGEMLNKPEVCRQSVSENNDELHSLKQAALKESSMSSSNPLSPRRMQPLEEVTTPNDENSVDPGSQVNSTDCILRILLGPRHDSALRNKFHSNTDGHTERGIQDCWLRSLATVQTFSKHERCRI